MKNKQTRRYTCDNCGAREFEITVEPMYPLEGMSEEWLSWLSSCAYCPQCGGEIEESK